MIRQLPASERAISAPRSFAVMIAALALLFVIAGVLTNAYRSQKIARADRHFQTAESLSRGGRQEEAIDHYRAALTISRGNPEYELALTLALMDTDRWAEAETHLGGFLSRHPTNGVANLMMARIRARQGSMNDAVEYYHRAIYGLWSRDEGLRRLNARLELAQFLYRRGARRQLLPELMQLRDVVPDKDFENSARLAQWFLWSGSPETSSEIYRQMLRQGKRDSETYAGLAEAELAAGNFAAASSAFRAALYRNPKNEDLRQRLKLAESVVSLHPALPRLSDRERYRRSRRLLEVASTELKTCMESKPEPDPQAARDLLSAAAKVLERRVSREPGADAEANTHLARTLWDVRRERCPTTGEASPLSVIFSAETRNERTGN